MSVTCQTTIAAISTGLPSASLTLRWLVSKLRTRTLTPSRTVSGSTHQKPGPAHGTDVPAEELDDPGLARLHHHQRRQHQGEGQGRYDHHHLGRRKGKPNGSGDTHGEYDDGDQAAEGAGAAFLDVDPSALMSDGRCFRDVFGGGNGVAHRRLLARHEDGT